MERGRNDENPVQRPLEVAAAEHHHHQPPPQKCPRCDSFNTKFCYYNNYSLSQPRYFCKACRRYWTHGGTLRNVPVGGGCRKSKRPRTTLSAATQVLPPRPQGFTAMASGQPSRPVAPPPIGGSFFTGGSFFSSLAAMHNLPGSQAAVPVSLGGGQFGGNMTLLQGVSLPSLKSPATSHQLQPASTHYNFPAGPFSSWSQGLNNTGGGASSSAATTSGFWSSNAGSGDQAGSSLAPNQWSDTHPGFNPSQ